MALIQLSLVLNILLVFIGIASAFIVGSAYGRFIKGELRQLIKVLVAYFNLMVALAVFNLITTISQAGLLELPYELFEMFKMIIAVVAGLILFIGAIKTSKMTESYSMIEKEIKDFFILPEDIFRRQRR